MYIGFAEYSFRPASGPIFPIIDRHLKYTCRMLFLGPHILLLSLILSALYSPYVFMSLALYRALYFDEDWLAGLQFQF